MKAESEMADVRIDRLTIAELERARELFLVMAGVFETPADPLSDRYLTRLLLVQGLRPWAGAPHDDAHGHGVSAPLRPAHPARFACCLSISFARNDLTASG